MTLRFARVMSGWPDPGGPVVFCFQVELDWVDEPRWPVFADLVVAFGESADIGYAEMGPRGGGVGKSSRLESALGGRYAPGVAGGRRFLRGYSWLTVCPREVLARLGGVAALAGSGAFYRVVPLAGGGAVLQATESMIAFDEVAGRRVFEAVRAVLPAGLPNARKLAGTGIVAEDADPTGTRAASMPVPERPAPVRPVPRRAVPKPAGVRAGPDPVEVAALLARHALEVPALSRRVELPSGLALLGFAATSEEALRWWWRLAEVAGRTGFQPIVVHPAEYYWLAGERIPAEDATAEQLIERAAAIDEKALIERLADLRLDRRTRAELAGAGQWPDDPVRVGFADLAVSWWDGSVYDTSVLLVPAAEAWQVPCVLGVANWNGYPAADRHGALLRYFRDRYAARLYAMSHDSVDLWIGRPPTSRPEALRTALEYLGYNDGAHDVYQHHGLTGMAACLIGADLWKCWWD